MLDPSRRSHQQREASGQPALSASEETGREVAELAGALTGDVRFMSDVYSFGIVGWEVLSTQVQCPKVSANYSTTVGYPPVSTNYRFEAFSGDETRLFDFLTRYVLDIRMVSGKY